MNGRWKVVAVSKIFFKRLRLIGGGLKRLEEVEVGGGWEMLEEVIRGYKRLEENGRC